MFDQLIESSSRKRQNKRRWLCFGATAAVWVPGMMTAVLAGVLAYDGRPSDHYAQPEKLVMLLPATPHDAPAQPTPPDKRSDPQPAALTAPKETPRGIPQPSNQAPVDVVVSGDNGPGHGPTVPGGDPNGDPNGSPNGVPGAPPGGTAPPPDPTPQPPPRKEEPPPTPTAKPRASIMLQGMAVRRVEPAYPKLALETRTGGPVVVEVVVDESGRVVSARALSGHALLRKAAEDAARGWRWNPTRLNGGAVQVVGTITFNFVL